MRELLLNSKVRLILALVVIVGIVGSLGGVYYLGQVNKSKALKGTKSKASVNTLDVRVETACLMEFNIVKPTPTLIPTATPTTTPTPIPTKVPTKTPTPTIPVCIGNADIALVIDRSSTMTDKESDGRQKMEWAKDAAIAFVDTLQKSGKTNVRVSISSFGAQGNDGTGTLDTNYNSTLHSPLSSNYADVKTAISSIKYIKSGTCVQCGIRIGNETLKDSPNPKYLILLSDGMANHTWNGGTSNSKTAAINEAKAPGVIYYTLGYGTGSEIDPSTLKSIAGTSGAYIYKPEAAQWSQGFLEILAKICTPGTGGNPTPTVVKPTATPKPPTPTSTPKPPTPTTSACVIPPPKDPPISICAPEGGLGSITWAWPPIRVATRYEVKIVDSNDKVLPNYDTGWQPAATFNCATGAECTYTTPNLAIGSYISKIRAGNPESECPPSTVSISKRMEVKACPVAPTGPPCSSNPVDIILSLDRSGSMSSGKVNGKTKLEWEKNGAKAFVETIKGQQNVRIGVVSWAGNNYKVSSLALTSDLNKVTSFIDSIKHDGGDQYTCIECALSKGANLLLNSKNRKVIVMMSDGIGNRVITSCDSKGTCKNAEPCDSRDKTKYMGTHCPPADKAAVDLAKTIKGEDITIHVIGYGTVKPLRILVDNLRAIAGNKTSVPNSNEFYHYGGDETTWDAVFANVVPQICNETKVKAKEKIKQSTERNRREGSRHDKDDGDD